MNLFFSPVVCFVPAGCHCCFLRFQFYGLDCKIEELIFFLVNFNITSQSYTLQPHEIYGNVWFVMISSAFISCWLLVLLLIWPLCSSPRCQEQCALRSAQSIFQLHLLKLTGPDLTHLNESSISLNPWPTQAGINSWITEILRSSDWYICRVGLLS